MIQHTAIWQQREIGIRYLGQCDGLKGFMLKESSKWQSRQKASSFSLVLLCPVVLSRLIGAEWEVGGIDIRNVAHCD